MFKKNKVIEMKISLAVLCVLALYTTGILLFTFGFLLRRVVVSQNSTCTLLKDDGFEADPLGSISDWPKTLPEGCVLPGRYRRAIFVVIDALRFDFVFKNRTRDREEQQPFENKLSNLTNVLENQPENARLYRFVADPPTTTLQRLKGLTTGSLPTFVDAGANFASPEITEDNFIDQLVRLGRNITFMGDDTWESLFPKRFRKSFGYPSFNVKDLDTVDDGIIQHFLPELRRNDWGVMIAHFLGVDHCGHTFGPYHQRMADKLMQMDSFLRSVMDEMEDDTILFVLGDHGMTRTGDHGGDIKEEVDAALFVYSPRPITASAAPQDGFKTVSQIDLVPTLSLLIGLPIPFSNLGSVISDLFDFSYYNDNRSELARLRQQLLALRVNARQVFDYVNEYAKLSNDLPYENTERLKNHFLQAENELMKVADVLKSNYDERVVRQRIEELKILYEGYLSEVKEMCRGIWAQFDLRSMFVGLAIFSLAVLVNVVLVLRGNNVAHRKLSFVDYAAVLMCFVYFLSLFSNSFVVHEDAVAEFLFQTLLILLSAMIIFSIFYRAISSNPKHTGHSKVEYFSVFLVLALFFCVSSAIRLSQNFRACREEQWTCETSIFLQPLTTFLHDSKVIAVFRLVLAIFSIALLTYGTCRYMQYCGNLNGSAIAVVMMSYLMPASALALVFYWSVLTMLNNIPNVAFLQGMLRGLPQFVYFISIATLVITVFRPLCLFLVSRKKETDERQEILLHPVGNENIIPQIYNHLKVNYKKSFKSTASTSASDDSQPPVVVYGLATVYTSSHLVVLTAIAMVIMLLLGDGVVPSFFLMWLALFAILEIDACWSRVVRDNDLIGVRWITVVMIFLLASEHFFSTGHQATIPSIRWEAAFHGFSGNFSTNVIPAVLVAINTFASYFFCTAALPLTIFWRFTRGRWITPKSKISKEENKGELVLCENGDLLTSSLCGVYMKYILLFGLKMMACMLCVTIHRRHLMVWKIFAPRFVYEGATFLLVSFVSVLVSVFVLRVDRCIESWIKKIDT